MAASCVVAAAAEAAGDPALAAGELLGRGKLTEAEQIARPCAGKGGGRAAPRCALVLGRILFARNDAAGAAAALAASGELGPLRPVRDALLGEALLLSGEPRRAVVPLRAAAAASGSSPAGLRAAALLADALHESGAEAAALVQAARAAALPGQLPQVKSGLAFTRVQALEVLAPRSRAAASEALGAARAFWLEHPDHPGAAAMPALEQRLTRLAGGALPAATGRELGLRASRLLAAGQPGAAVAQAREALGLLQGAEAAEVDLLFARALGADGRRAEATQALEAAWAAGAPSVAAPAGLLLARDRARRGALRPAMDLLDELARKLPAAPEAEEAAYLAARLLLEAEGPDSAAARQRLSTLAEGTTRHASDARWTLAWLSYKAHGPDAAGRFAAFAALAGDDATRAQGLYWQARASPGEAAAALLARVAALDPLGWYGLLAAPEPARQQPPFPPQRTAPASGTPSSLALASQLVGLGFLSEAAAEVDRYVRQHHGRGAELLPALALYERAGRYDRSVVVAENALIGRSLARADPIVRGLLEAAYPTAYAELVAASAGRARIDPYFLLAVARRESVFRPDVRSAAGAVGLLQLTPATARRIAAVLGRPAGSDDELFEPSGAIDLGAWYLSELVGRFGDPALAAAAYNAGTRAVEPWAARGAGERLDEWVEDIPFRETRQYVKAVAGAWSAYRILAGGAPPRLIATVPAVRAGAEF